MANKKRLSVAALTRAAFAEYAKHTYPRGQTWGRTLIPNERKAWREAVATVLLLVNPEGKK